MAKADTPIYIYIYIYIGVCVFVYARAGINKNIKYIIKPSTHISNYPNNKHRNLIYVNSPG